MDQGKTRLHNEAFHKKPIYGTWQLYNIEEKDEFAKIRTILESRTPMDYGKSAPFSSTRFTSVTFW
jgi:hypothetical protein